MAESARKKRVPGRAEKEFEQALKVCRWLTEKPKKPKRNRSRPDIWAKKI